jgi:long-chain fatty acid transport protein
MTMPQTITVSGYQQLTDQWAVMANVGWQVWSQFGKVSADLSTPTASASNGIDADFNDTWHGAQGAHYRIAEPWLLMAGFAYATSPVKDEKRSRLLCRLTVRSVMPRALNTLTTKILPSVLTTRLSMPVKQR